MRIGDYTKKVRKLYKKARRRVVGRPMPEAIETLEAHRRLWRYDLPKLIRLVEKHIKPGTKA